MKLSNKWFRRIISSPWERIRGQGPAPNYTGDTTSFRSELFNSDQMKQHGKALAGMHQLKPGRRPDHLLVRLADNEILLRDVHKLLTEDVKANRRITPAGEWLLDNFYVIEEQLRTAKRHLPKEYSRELPYLQTGPSAELPRVYDIALEAISHSDGRLDVENLLAFVTAYQSVVELDLGELWAIPIMLRLALIENLRRIAVQIAETRNGYISAEYWADQLLNVATKDPKSLILTIADMARSQPPMKGSFIAEFSRRLQGQPPSLELALTWLEQRLSEAGLSVEQLVSLENRQQAADQVSMSNSIYSLRFLGGMDWREFVETASHVEQTLRDDPSDIYRKMDFATRDRYRHAVEKAAKGSPLSETGISKIAIQLTREGAARHGNSNREAHVGFYLIDEGIARLAKRAKVSTPANDLLGRFSRRYLFYIYVGAILFLTTVLAGFLVSRQYALEGAAWMLGLVGLLSLLSTSHLAVAVVNWVATLLATPHLLPRMDFSKGIPRELRTLVVVPTMLTNNQKIEDLVKGLEVRFLTNRHDHLHFGLLTDFGDAKEEALPEDEPLLGLAQQRIEELNRKYPCSEGDSFFLFHRPRRWNQQERIWMGYERKRGKLADLNGFLRGKNSDRFSRVVGETTILSGVKYVITLDGDTQLSRDSIWQFVGAMAHPLNRAEYDESRGLVVKGYGIIQPRVAMSLPGANRSQYARMCSNELGIDPYTRAVSDVYQDLFGEGSFIGKGIYDVDVFERALGGRFPENLILSHDLLEGAYARSGLLSDVHLYEEYPLRYNTDVDRRQRWIRGDWQIAQWVMPVVPGPDRRLRKNPLSLLSRWKLFDNLRRSLCAAALTLLLFLGWTMLQSAGFWTLAVIGIILGPSLFASALTAFQKAVDMTLKQHLTVAVHSARRCFAQTVFALTCLPYEAFFSLDAIFRTIWRMTIAHARLLEWNPSGDSPANRSFLLQSYREMWIAPLIAVVAGTALAFTKPVALTVAGPILCLWFASPVIAWWVSRPLSRRRERLTEDQTLFLRKLARKTWAFFETFVGPDDHWLPPDNYQEHPVEVVAHRTSPTNMGLALLANMSAYDFCHISTGRLIERTANALHTMEGLERYKGHFYNWYDTQTLKPLPPVYISSVDSGNLAGHLLTLRPGLIGLADQKILGVQFFESIRTTLGIITEAAAGLDVNALPQLAQLKRNVETATHSPPVRLSDSSQCIQRLAISAEELVVCVESFEVDLGAELRWWARAFARQCRDAFDELKFLAPWTEIPLSQNDNESFPDLDAIPTLRELAMLDLKFRPAFLQQRKSSGESTENDRASDVERLIKEASMRARERIRAIEHLALQCLELARMEYDFLYGKTLHLLAIGYHPDNYRQDSSYYDLLASEARFACFIGIAQGRLPQESWFSLGRLLTTAGGAPILLSWSGSMFEYLMPLLVMPTYENTLLDQTYQAVVAGQIEYGKKRGVPWGISECGYNSIDVHRNYQYRAFGVPGLGLKRGLAERSGHCALCLGPGANGGA